MRASRRQSRSHAGLITKRSDYPGRGGYLTLDKTASDHLFSYCRAYENVSLLLLAIWILVNGNPVYKSGTAAALLDRLLHHAHVITLRGDSYRIRNRLVPPHVSQVKEG